MKWQIVGALAIVLLTAYTAPADEPKLVDRQIDELIARLGSDNFEEREEATRRLLQHEEAIPALRRARQSPDAEVARRAREILEGFARRTAGDKVKDEFKKLQGEWPVRVLEIGGHGRSGNYHDRLVIKDDKLTIYRMGVDKEKKKIKEDSNSFRIKLDPTASPKTVDLIRLDGPGKGEVVECVYDVDDNELGLCLPGTNEPRPDGLYTIEGPFSGRWLYKCKRPKKPDEATAKELKKFNGTWLMTACEMNGREWPQRVGERRKCVSTISDGKFTVTRDGKEGDSTYTFELVDIKSDPKKIDVQEISKLTGTIIKWEGIYKLDGDVLTICMDCDQTGRPGAFASKPSTSRGVTTLKRQKP